MECRTQRFPAFLLAAFVCLFFSKPFDGQLAKQQHARLSLISQQASLAPGQSEWIGLRFELDPGWHIYWTNPGDSGEPPKVSWQLPDGFRAGELQFPAPKRIPDHSLVDYGYEGSVVLLARLTRAGSSSSNSGEIAADVKYLVCRDVCIPAQDRASLNAESAPGSRNAAQIGAARKHLPQSLPPGSHISARATADNFILTVGTRSTPALGQVTDFIPADEQVIENTARPVIEPGLDGEEIRLKKSEQLNHPVRRLRGLLICGERAYNISIPVSSDKKQSSMPMKE